MCDNPNCDICHDDAAPRERRARAAKRGVPPRRAKAARASLRGTTRESLAGIGAITLFMAALAGATALGLWQLAPAVLHLPG
jgi:hypothetical protein